MDTSLNIYRTTYICYSVIDIIIYLYKLGQIQESFTYKQLSMNKILEWSE